MAHYTVAWSNISGIVAQDYTCGYCGREVSAAQGWKGHSLFVKDDGAAVTGSSVHVIAVCPRCGQPTYLVREEQTPGVPFGEHVEFLPQEVGTLYQEARRSIAANNANAAVMVARKLLMNIAVTQGAETGKSFKAYVDYLEQQGVVTANMKDWVDEIRELGNDANHELPHMTRDEAEAILTFVTMLLKIVYEFPERGRQSVAAREAKQPRGSAM